MRSLPSIAKSLNTPIATLRYRIKPYEDFLPYTTTSKGREYNEQTEGIIREINTYINKDKQQEEILQLLASKYIRDIEVVTETTTPTTSEQQPQNEQLIRLNNNLEMLVSRLDRQTELEKQVHELRVKMASLQKVNKERWWKFW